MREAENLVERLRKSSLTVITAESCTGGLVAACLTHGREASECCMGAFVAYAKIHKSDALGVDSRLLAEEGAVNFEVARQMCEGALQRSQASLAISITGVLGPDPDEDDNPPGLVYFGLARRGTPTKIVRCEFAPGDPDAVREEAVLKAFQLLDEVAGTALSGTS